MSTRKEKADFRRPFDAFTWAASRRNRRAAREILEGRKHLSWQEASAWAPWTLNWAPELLERILELYGEEDELYCVYALSCRRGWEICVWGSLLTGAAAADDLAAVKLLLERGYETDENDLYRQISLSPHLPQIGRLESNGVNPLDVNRILCLPAGRPDKWPHLLRAYLDQAGPLSAAIFCGAGRCARYLLERLMEREGWKLNLSVRWALIQRYDHGDPVYDALVEELTGILGGEIPDLLDPGDFQDRRDPRFRECLRRHAGEEINRSLIQYLLATAPRDPDAREALEGVDPVLASGCLLEALGNREAGFMPERRIRMKEFIEMKRRTGFRLVLDRNAVPPEADGEDMLLYLENAEVVGEIPPGALSGLSVCLLNGMMRERRGAEALRTPARWLTQPLVRSGRVQRALRQEDPAMVRGYLEYLAREKREDYPLAGRMSELLLSLLGIGKEAPYGL